MIAEATAAADRLDRSPQDRSAYRDCCRVEASLARLRPADPAPPTSLKEISDRLVRIEQRLSDLERHTGFVDPQDAEIRAALDRLGAALRHADEQRKEHTS